MINPCTFNAYITYMYFSKQILEKYKNIIMSNDAILKSIDGTVAVEEAVFFV